MTGTVRKSNGSDDEEDLVELAFHQYVTNQGYPKGCSDGRKRTIRWKAKKFEVVGGELFYITSLTHLLHISHSSLPSLISFASLTHLLHTIYDGIQLIFNLNELININYQQLFSISSP